MKRYLIHDFANDPGLKPGGKDYAREPIIRPMKDGRIICTFLTGGPTEPHNDNVLKLSWSDDGGKNWSDPEVIISHGKRGVWCTELFTEGDDPFLVVMTYNAANLYRDLLTYRSFSRDGGCTWEEPVSFPSGLNNVTLRQGIVLSNGDWLFPLYWQENRAVFDWTKRTKENWQDGGAYCFCCGVAVSSDRGTTYQRFGYLTDKLSLWEPNCIELENGHIVMLMRDNSRPYLRRSDSYDYGRTWDKPQPTDIPNPNTKLTLLKINGKILLINNFRAEMGWEKRDHLMIHVSSDNMATWEKKLPLTEADERFFYPHAYADTEKRELCVAYENSFQHYFCRIPYEELGID